MLKNRTYKLIICRNISDLWDCTKFNADFYYKVHLYIPDEYRPYDTNSIVKKQKTREIVALLDKIGKFPVEVNPDGIKIIAYKP